MEYKLIFFALTALALLVIPLVLAGLTAIIGRLMGMQRTALLALVVSVATAAGGGTIALASLTASLMFPT